jgi:hypothetical protein
MEKIKCNSCEIEKDITSFYKCKGCKDGVSKVCKLCKTQGRLSTRSQATTHPFNIKFRQTEESFYNMAGTTPKDYKDMWEILSLIGYNVEEDIHHQFVDKINQTLLKPMKYKKKKHITSFLPNGEPHPNRRGQKKTPIQEE